MSSEDFDIETKVSRASAHDVQPTSWGKLVWQVSAEQKNSELMTVGICYIDPGQENGRHYHPDCEEVLAVWRGHIVHTWEDKEVEMREGDTITIPAGVMHNARNIGDGVAELAICFSSAYRTTVAEEEGSGPA
ncbi:cupin domain-containing protein [Aquamicrobium sp. NLF2-7]|uniref:cupin domain-containing protein n=1 Tax=Aquamicrobium sp. NLF2-7 TaxID=2918753 RepID=UPI001EFAC093|nr:cupin domain-containing protein [Aquamicrobium sp. NLF2-7]MCG8272713.1 cupin domain-containing protein [Aquamicrobium sp. NLF2-7]